jgi:CBS domain-containing membrane protein
MTTQVLTANVDTHVFDLVPLLSDAGLHHIPILDNQKKVVGMVTQSDLIAALYSVKLAE